MRQIHEFHVDSTRYLDDHGKPLSELPPQAKNTERVLAAYRNMVLTRTFDAKAIALQRTGKCGTYPSVLGHEVVGTAIGQSLTNTDVFVPYYRDQATHILRGVSLKELLLYWGGDERGSAWEHCPQELPIAVPIATQCCHAVGVASAFRIRGEARAVVCCLGDGGTSKGDFLESINLAGAWHLPVVFVVINNQWAISTPRSLQTGAETIAQKAISAGLPGHIVDGNDYFATADDATRYRSAEDLKRAWGKDGIKRLQNWLHDSGLWSPDKEKALQAECKQTVDKAVADYLATEAEPPTAMLDYLFETLPTALQGQREQIAEKHRRGAA